MRGWAKSIFQQCNKDHLTYKQGGGKVFDITKYQNEMKQKNQSLFLRSFDPCGMQRGALHCPWLKDDLRAAGPGFFLNSLPGLRPFNGSNATCVHLRINDAYLERVANGMDFGEIEGY